MDLQSSTFLSVDSRLCNCRNLTLTVNADSPEHLVKLSFRECMKCNVFYIVGTSLLFGQIKRLECKSSIS